MAQADQEYSGDGAEPPPSLPLILQRLVFLGLGIIALCVGAYLFASDNSVPKEQEQERPAVRSMPSNGHLPAGGGE